MVKPIKHRVTVTMAKPWVHHTPTPKKPSKNDVLEALADAIWDGVGTPTTIADHFDIKIEPLYAYPVTTIVVCPKVNCEDNRKSETPDEKALGTHVCKNQSAFYILKCKGAEAVVKPKEGAK